MHVLTTIDKAEIARLRAADEFFWIDVTQPEGPDIERLGHALGLHPVALEDTVEFGQRPKVDPYDEQLLLVFYTARVPAEPIEVHIYISGGFIATIRHQACDTLEDLHTELAELPTDEEELVVYSILDRLTDAFFPVVDSLERTIDQLEAEVLTRPRKEHLERSYRLKQDVRGLHRLAVAQKEQFHSAHEMILALPGFERGSKPYLRDVGDHLIQVASEFQRQTEDLISLTQTYFNANADRLNNVASRLTVGGTIFVVWTVVTGFFGQNFGFLVDNIESREKFLILGVGGMLIPTVILLTLFWVKRRDWF